MASLKPDTLVSADDGVDPESSSRPAAAPQAPFDWIWRNKLIAFLSFVIIMFLMIVFVYWIAVAENHRWYTTANPRDTYVGTRDVYQEMATKWVDARVTCSQIEKDDIPFLPDLGETYKVQDQMIEDHTDKLGSLVGWKVGTTSRTMWPTFNLDEPSRAPLFSKYVRFGNVSGNWEEDVCGSFHIYEGEFAFVLGSTLEPREEEYTEAEVLAAIGFVAPAVEIVSSRADSWCLADLMAWYLGDFEDPLAAMASCQADAGISGLVIIGEEVPASEVEILKLVNNSLSLTAQISGQTPTLVQNTGAIVLDGPLSALTWLVNELSEHNRALRKGDVVMSGGIAVHVTEAEEIGQRFDITVASQLRGAGSPPTAVKVSLGSGSMVVPGGVSEPEEQPDLNLAAATYLSARKDCARVLREEVVLLSTMEQAFEVFDRMLESDILGAVGGWKVGASGVSYAGSPQGLISAPLFVDAILSGPWNLTLAELCDNAGIAYEGEIAVTMGADLPPREAEYTSEEVWAAVSHLEPAIEIIGTRMPSHCPAYVPAVGDPEGWSPFGDGKANNLATCLSDFGANILTVLSGAKIPKEELPQPGLIDSKSAMKDAMLKLEMDCGSGDDSYAIENGRELLVDPLESVRWLANHLSRRGHTLKRGHVVMTGMLAIIPQRGEGSIDAAAIEGQCSINASVMFDQTSINPTWYSAELLVTDFPPAS